MPETRSDAEAKRKVWEMIKDVNVAMMVTQDDEGHFRGRPMRAVNKEFDGVLWFFASAGSPVTGETRDDGRVLLGLSQYSAPSQSTRISSIFGSSAPAGNQTRSGSLQSAFCFDTSFTTSAMP